MKEIEETIKQIIELLERSMEKADSINNKLDSLLEAITNQNRPPLGPR